MTKDGITREKLLEKHMNRRYGIQNIRRRAERRKFQKKKKLVKSDNTLISTRFQQIKIKSNRRTSGKKNATHHTCEITHGGSRCCSSNSIQTKCTYKKHPFRSPFLLAAELRVLNIAIRRHLCVCAQRHFYILDCHIFSHCYNARSAARRSLSLSSNCSS